MRNKKQITTPSEDLNSATKSIDGLLSYKISYAPDFTLQWDPPAGSKALAVSLSYNFPLEPDLESKMKAAMFKFLQDPDSPAARPKSQISETNRYLTPEDDEYIPKLDIISVSSTTRLRKRNGRAKDDNGLKVVAWDPEKGSKGGFKRDVKRRKYEAEEGAKVARNRGYACEMHRRQKLKVNRP